MFDLLINSEVIVDDVAMAERTLIDALGFPPQKPQWSNTTPGKGFTFLFARVHSSLKVSPTRIEAMAVAPVDDSADPATTIQFLPALMTAQGRRPWKTHANELATSDIHGVAERLRQNGCRFFTMPATEGNPFTRLWLGWTGADPGRYEPDVDGGLMLEICETGALMQGAQLWDPVPALDLPPGSMVRVLRRSWIVEDLDQSLAALDRNLALVPRFGPDVDRGGAWRSARFDFAHSRSAELEVLEPIGPGEVRDSLETWGPGAWVIRIGVTDLEAKAEDLDRRGTSYERRREEATAETLWVDTGPLGMPGLFEFAEVDELGSPLWEGPTGSS
jgi:hypothetical protein